MDRTAMLSRTQSFRILAATGYAVIIALLALGVALTVHRLDSVASTQLAQIRADEQEIRLAVQLHEIGEHISSAERGYLLTRDAELATRIGQQRRDFDATLRTLQSGRLLARDPSLASQVARAAAEFEEAGRSVLAALNGHSDGQLLQLFDTELLPRERALTTALDQLVAHHRQAIARSYDDAHAARRDLAGWMDGLLAIGVLASLAIGWFFTRQLARMYRSEQDAREIAQKAVATRDQVMAIVAHDLRNPLGAIVLKAEILENEAPTGAARRQAASIANIAMRTEYLVKAMLEVADIDERRFEIRRSLCLVDELIESTVQMFGEAASAKGIQLVIDSRPSGLAIHADREQMLQALSILVGNAIKFTPTGSHVTIAAQPVERQIRFSVSDHGPGISSEHLPGIFDRFAKGDDRAKDGTALGLFVAKTIVEAHGGRIWAESESGQGATFALTVPVEDAPALRRAS